ncbi:hypothetical protein [Mycolicibacterium sp. CBMA 226]|uniref:hypothetical protein n=1 Tax=Mycolicibacterium sp. CBMA 226 TaxID=2606611 RepID=UPI0012DDA3FA|nr:hypothetical protein [Mycolicibacterium sp. CBMA 226]MUL78473.1 hypothetical protein [Mycolicibacterium sp. CBMA 226]
MKLVLCAHRRGEPERVGERLGLDQVGLLELEPDDVLHLDDRIRATPRMFAATGTLFAVQVVMRADELVGHFFLSFRYVVVGGN